jgi:hypothetical protein
MTHLSSAEFVDLVEGVRAEASAPHLSECDRCRRELADLRDMMAAATSLPIPEPSPLFWDHLSARVEEAVRQEESIAAERPVRVALFNSWWIRVAAGVAMSALVAAVAVTLSSRQNPPSTPPPELPALAATPGDDTSLDLVADFGGTLDWDDLREQMSVSTHPGVLDGGVGALDAGERQELERLLKQELARPAARTDRS